jgi:phosphatidylinositol 4-kinase A
VQVSLGSRRRQSQCVVVLLLYLLIRSRWSFGGNRLQIKAETHILSDIQSHLQSLTHPERVEGAALKSLKAKQDLLSLLLSNEQTRLMVWLFPLDYEKKHHFTSGQHSKTLADVGFALQK